MDSEWDLRCLGCGRTFGHKTGLSNHRRACDKWKNFDRVTVHKRRRLEKQALETNLLAGHSLQVPSETHTLAQSNGLSSPNGISCHDDHGEKKSVQVQEKPTRKTKKTRAKKTKAWAQTEARTQTVNKERQLGGTWATQTGTETKISTKKAIMVQSREVVPSSAQIHNTASP